MVLTRISLRAQNSLQLCSIQFILRDKCEARQNVSRTHQLLRQDGQARRSNKMHKPESREDRLPNGGQYNDYCFYLHADGSFVEPEGYFFDKQRRIQRRSLAALLLSRPQLSSRMLCRQDTINSLIGQSSVRNANKFPQSLIY